MEGVFREEGGWNATLYFLVAVHCHLRWLAIWYCRLEMSPALPVALLLAKDDAAKFQQHFHWCVLHTVVFSVCEASFKILEGNYVQENTTEPWRKLARHCLNVMWNVNTGLVVWKDTKCWLLDFMLPCIGWLSIWLLLCSLVCTPWKGNIAKKDKDLSFHHQSCFRIILSRNVFIL